MGTDIHVIVQQRSTEPDQAQIEGIAEGVIVGSESDVVTRSASIWNTIEIPKYVEFALRSRNYEVFSLLAGVRGSLPAISAPRGLPADLVILGDPEYPFVYAPTYEYAQTTEDAGKYPEDYPPELIGTIGLGDHDFSWLTLRDLVSYPWAALLTREGYISRRDFGRWDGTIIAPSGTVHVNPYFGRQRMNDPNSWSRMVYGPKIISEDEMRRLDRPESGAVTAYGDADPYTHCTWEVPIARAAGDLFTVAIPYLVTIAGGDMDSLRLVFGFDS